MSRKGGIPREGGAPARGLQRGQGRVQRDGVLGDEGTLRVPGSAEPRTSTRGPRPPPTPRLAPLSTQGRQRHFPPLGFSSGQRLQDRTDACSRNLARVAVAFGDKCASASL